MLSFILQINQDPIGDAVHLDDEDEEPQPLASESLAVATVRVSVGEAQCAIDVVDEEIIRMGNERPDGLLFNCGERFVLAYNIFLENVFSLACSDSNCCFCFDSTAR